ncbi:hypothetical protein Tco_1256207 [Tanacetum coccineum]
MQSPYPFASARTPILDMMHRSIPQGLLSHQGELEQIVSDLAILEKFSMNHQKYPTKPKNEQTSDGVLGDFQFLTALILLGST